MVVKRPEACPSKITASGLARVIRMVLKADGLGFSVSDVRIKAGQESVLWYKHHLEANYILEGKGEVEDLTTRERFALEAGMLYIVGPKDRHRLKSTTDLHILSVLNPPLVGDEQHAADGTFPPSGPLPADARG